MRIRPLLLLALLAACGGDARASRPGADSTAARPATAGEVAGFASMDWGTTREQIQAARGTPATVHAYRDGVVGLGYLEGEPLYGATMRSLFMAHPTHGLFRGAYIARPARTAECEVVYGMLEQHVSGRYPALKPESQRGNESALPFCEGVMQGTAARVTRWKDAAGTVIMLMMAPGSPDILLLYSNAHANAWEAAGKGTQLEF